MKVTIRPESFPPSYHHDGMERKQVQFTRQQVAALRREAKRRRVSESAVVRDAVDAWLRTHDEDIRRERVARALSVIGKFSSGGGRNIAVEHDRELGDIYFAELRRKP